MISLNSLAIACCSSLLLLASCATHVPSRVEGIENQVRTLTPGLDLTFEAAASEAPAPYSLRRFTYGRAPGWPYGEGFAVADSTSGTVLWIHLRNGDFPPHRIRWADFDGDGRLDISFHAGEEDVFSSSVFLNRVVGNRFGLSHFASTYEISGVYAVVLDIAADGHPELLIPEESTDAEDPCAAEFRDFEENDREARETYIRLAGPFADFNVTFSSEETDVAGLALFDRIQVITFDAAGDAEPLHRHLDWRLARLSDARNAITPDCRERIDRTIEHLEWLRKHSSARGE